MALIEALASIVGSDNVSGDPDVLEKYSKDYSFVQARMPSCVAFPKKTEEIQGIVKYANEHLIPVTPRSSTISFYGAGIPSQGGGIIVDLTKMNRILEVDARNRKVKVEPGVTWAQVQKELEKQGLMVCSPLLPHPAKSVLTSTLESELMLIPKPEYSEVCMTGAIVLPSNGSIYYTGNAIWSSVGSSIGGFVPDMRLFVGAQGTLGIVAWANLKAEYTPKMDKLFFIPFDKVEDIADPIYRIGYLYLGSECLVLNSFNLALILTDVANWPQEFNALRKSLPLYTLISCLSGTHRRPKEKIAYEEKALTKVASELGFEVQHTVGGTPRLEEKVLKMLRKPWQGDGYWKFRYKGACHDIFFYTTLNRVPEFTKVINEIATKHEYPTADIGFYLQPIERGRACFCQYSFHCTPDNSKDVEKVHKLYLEASERAISMGGLFTTPYGPWADMVYSRTPNYTTTLKLVKNAFDPNNIMNPGKLCF